MLKNVHHQLYKQKLEINLFGKMLTRNTSVEIRMEKKLTQTFRRERSVGFSYFDL